MPMDPNEIKAMCPEGFEIVTPVALKGKYHCPKCKKISPLEDWRFLTDYYCPTCGRLCSVEGDDPKK